MFRISIILLIAATTSLCSAQNRLDSDLFGTGVHQYFRGQHQEAINTFTLAIASAPKDPRSYFFRGLSKDCNWGNCSGDDDFRQGAYWETFKSGQASSSVNRALERIQGCRRLAIEKIRREARLSYQITKNLPPSKATPIMFGEMIDVNSLTPLIENVIPIQSTVPQMEVTQPSEEVIQPQEEIVDFDTTPLDSREVIPTDATPMPEDDEPESNETKEFEPEGVDEDDPFSTAQFDGN